MTDIVETVARAIYQRHLSASTFHQEPTERGWEPYQDFARAAIDAYEKAKPTNFFPPAQVKPLDMAELNAVVINAGDHGLALSVAVKDQEHEDLLRMMAHKLLSSTDLEDLRNAWEGRKR